MMQLRQLSSIVSKQHISFVICCRRRSSGKGPKTAQKLLFSPLPYQIFTTMAAAACLEKWKPSSRFPAKCSSSRCRIYSKQQQRGWALIVWRKQIFLPHLPCLLETWMPALIGSSFGFLTGGRDGTFLSSDQQFGQIEKKKRIKIVWIIPCVLLMHADVHEKDWMNCCHTMEQINMPKIKLLKLTDCSCSEYLMADEAISLAGKEKWIKTVINSNYALLGASSIHHVQQQNPIICQLRKHKTKLKIFQNWALKIIIQAYCNQQKQSFLDCWRSILDLICVLLFFSYR